MKFSLIRRTCLTLPLLMVGPFLGAQAAKLKTDTIYFETKIGSFKLLNCVGKTSFSFEGTVLVAGLEGTAIHSGNLKTEYENKDKKRVAYFGKGTITVTGKWRGIQWFGKNLNGYFDGNGIMRLAGEFDEKMNTGHYWYKSNPQKEIWYSVGIERTIPPPDFLKSTKPVRKGGG